MLTLSYGFKKPQTPDPGSIVFPALEANWQLVNDHTHDGANSSKISAAGINPVSDTISSGSWTSVGGGMYKQTITSVVVIDNYIPSFRVSGGTYDGHFIYPKLVRLTSTTFDIYVNDNSLNLDVIYR